MPTLVVGFGLGFFVAAQLGPLSLFAIRSTLRSGASIGLAIGAGVAVIDTLYAAAGAAGAAALLEIEPLRAAFGLTGAAVLIYLGIRTLVSAFRVRLGGEVDDEVNSPRKAFATALGATASNPLTIASWAAIFTAAGAAGAAEGAGVAVLLAGVGLGSMTWMAILATGVSVARRWVGDRTLRAVDGLAGAGLLGFGGLLAYRTLERPASLARRMSFYVTTPIYYVNAAPHLGHAYSTIGADILARHHRQRGEDVFFLTGTDEHGEPVALAAEKEGVTPKELADRNAARFEALMPRINASNDFFIRTSDPRHKERVQAFMQRVHDNGHVYKGLYEGWYCPRCADFKGENEIAEGNTCPIHRIPLDREEEENWFFRLSAFQEQLEQLYAERRLRRAAHPLQRGALVHHRRPQRRLAQPREAHLGRRGPVGSRARLLRLVRRAAQLLHGAVLRGGRARPHRGAVAGDAADPRQGHPQVPRRDLARDAAGRRRGAPAEAVHPRLPDLKARRART